MTDNKKDDFFGSSKKLFDIFSCKCNDFLQFKSPDRPRVAKEGQIFMADQKTEIQMIIGGIDISETIKMMKRCEEKEKVYHDSVTNSEKQKNKVECPARSLVLLDESEHSNKAGDILETPNNAGKIHISACRPY